jgi:hypothetical protein
MPYTIIEADLHHQRQEIENIFERNRGVAVPDHRFDWLYLGNPFGKARVWLIQDTQTRRFFGTSAVLPRQMWVNGQIAQCYVMADFSIDQEYRALGPAIKLNKAALAAIQEGPVRFGYDFPSQSMAKVHEWSKCKPLGSLVRYVRPMKSRAVLEKKLGSGIHVQVLSAGADHLLKLFKPRIGSGYDVDHHPLSGFFFDSSFEGLDNRVGPTFAICGRRSPDYLQWRYGQNPLHQFFNIQIRYRQDLAGFCVYTIDGQGRMQIFDLYADQNREVQNSLLAAVIQVAQEKGTGTVEMSFLEGNPWEPVMKKSYFFRRDADHQVFAFTNHTSSLSTIGSEPASWFMNNGDRDT